MSQLKDCEDVTSSWGHSSHIFAAAIFDFFLLTEMKKTVLHQISAVNFKFFNSNVVMQ